MKYSSKILLFCLCVVFQTGCSSQAVYTAESFAIDSPFKLKVDDEVDTACESARRALLGQGYLIESSNSDGIKARKAYKSEDDQNTFIEMTIVCLPERNGSTLFATGVLSAYALKKSTSSASVGLSALGSISLPIGQSADSLVKVSEETINDKDFYQRFFAAVENTLGEMRAGKVAPEPVAPEPGPAEPVLPATVAGPEPVPVEVTAPVPPVPAPVLAPAAPVTVAEPVPQPAAPVVPAPEPLPQPVAPAPEPVPASVAPIVTAPEALPPQTAPATAAEPIPQQAAPAPVPPAPVPELAAPAGSPEPVLRQRQDAPAVTPEQSPVAVPAAVPAPAAAPAESAPVIAAEPGPDPLQQAPEPAVLEELQPITVQRARRPVIAPVVLPEPEPTAVQEAPTAAPEKLPPIDPFR